MVLAIMWSPRGGGGSLEGGWCTEAGEVAVPVRTELWHLGGAHLKGEGGRVRSEAT